MSRYLVEGLISDIERGKYVLYVGRNRAEVQAVFAACAGRAEFVKVYRSNGRERISHESGGVVEFRTAGQTLRGVAPDVLVVSDRETLRVPDVVPITFHAEVIYD